jgi:hypothetical protein
MEEVNVFQLLGQVSSLEVGCHRAVQKGPVRGEIGSGGGVEGYHRYRWNGVQARLLTVG